MQRPARYAPLAACYGVASRIQRPTADAADPPRPQTQTQTPTQISTSRFLSCLHDRLVGWLGCCLAPIRGSLIRRLGSRIGSTAWLADSTAWLSDCWLIRPLGWLIGSSAWLCGSTAWLADLAVCLGLPRPKVDDSTSLLGLRGPKLTTVLHFGASEGGRLDVRVVGWHGWGGGRVDGLSTYASKPGLNYF